MKSVLVDKLRDHLYVMSRSGMGWWWWGGDPVGTMGFGGVYQIQVLDKNVIGRK